MPSFDFPASPTDGQTYTANGITYVYDLAKTRWAVQPDTWDETTITGHIADSSIHMDQTVYDPTLVQADMFDLANHYGNLDGGTFN